MQRVKYTSGLAFGAFFFAVVAFYFTQNLPVSCIAVIVSLAMGTALQIGSREEGPTPTATGVTVASTANHSPTSSLRHDHVGTGVSSPSLRLDHGSGNVNQSNCVNRVPHGLAADRIEMTRNSRLFDGVYMNRVTVSSPENTRTIWSGVENSRTPLFAQPHLQTPMSRSNTVSVRQSPDNSCLGVHSRPTVHTQTAHQQHNLPQFRRFGVGAIDVTQYDASQMDVDRTSLVEPAIHHPQYVTFGIMPAVRLTDRERSFLGQHNSHMVNNPLTVKVAPPDTLHKQFHMLSSPVPHSSSDGDGRNQTESVLQALRNKRKRGAVEVEDAIPGDMQVEQQPKRCRYLNTNTSAQISDGFVQTGENLLIDGFGSEANQSNQGLLQTVAMSSVGRSDQSSAIDDRIGGGTAVADNLLLTGGPKRPSVDNDGIENHRKRPRHNSGMPETASCSYSGVRNPVDVSYSSARRYENRLSVRAANAKTESHQARHHPYSMPYQSNVSSHHGSSRGRIQDEHTRARHVHNSPPSSLPPSARSTPPLVPVTNVCDRVPSVADDTSSLYSSVSARNKVRRRLTPSHTEVKHQTLEISPCRQHLTAEDFERDRSMEMERVRDMISEPERKKTDTAGSTSTSVSTSDVVTVCTSTVTTTLATCHVPAVNLVTTSIITVPSSLASTVALTPSTSTPVLSVTSSLPVSARLGGPDQLATTTAPVHFRPCTTAVASVSPASTSSAGGLTFPPIFPVTCASLTNCSNIAASTAALNTAGGGGGFMFHKSTAQETSAAVTTTVFSLLSATCSAGSGFTFSPLLPSSTASGSSSNAGATVTVSSGAAPANFLLTSSTTAGTVLSNSVSTASTGSLFGWPAPSFSFGTTVTSVQSTLPVTSSAFGVQPNDKSKLTLNAQPVPGAGFPSSRASGGITLPASNLFAVPQTTSSVFGVPATSNGVFGSVNTSSVFGNWSAMNSSSAPVPTLGFSSQPAVNNATSQPSGFGVTALQPSAAAISSSLTGPFAFGSGSGATSVQQDSFPMASPPAAAGFGVMNTNATTRSFDFQTPPVPSSFNFGSPLSSGSFTFGANASVMSAFGGSQPNFGSFGAPAANPFSAPPTFGTMNAQQNQPTMFSIGTGATKTRTVAKIHRRPTRR